MKQSARSYDNLFSLWVLQCRIPACILGTNWMRGQVRTASFSQQVWVQETAYPFDTANCEHTQQSLVHQYWTDVTGSTVSHGLAHYDWASFHRYSAPKTSILQWWFYLRWHGIVVVFSHAPFRRHQFAKPHALEGLHPFFAFIGRWVNAIFTLSKPSRIDVIQRITNHLISASLSSRGIHTSLMLRNSSWYPTAYNRALDFARLRYPVFTEYRKSFLPT